MNKLTNEKRAQILGCLVEGMGVKATARIADVSHVTVLKFIGDLGKACSEYMDKTLRNLSCKRIQVDEVWSFVYAKQKNEADTKRTYDHAGDVWTWIAIDPQTKLIPCYYVGSRNAECANEFIGDLASRLSHRIQLTSDGHKPYLDAVEGAFGADVDYAMLIKIYGESVGGGRYSPSEFVSLKKEVVQGCPSDKHISTSIIERQNLTVRMTNRRFTRLTNGYSKKLENHIHMISIGYMVYNFVKIHGSLRMSPAMAAEVTNHLWSLQEVVSLLNG